MVKRGVCGRGVCMAGETATAVDSTHPAGMHSCSEGGRKLPKWVH